MAVLTFWKQNDAKKAMINCSDNKMTIHQNDIMIKGEVEMLKCNVLIIVKKNIYIYTLKIWNMLKCLNINIS